MEFITYNNLCDDIVNNFNRIPKDVDVIVGIPRSGLMLASIIALYMNKPIVDIDSFLKGMIFSSGMTKNKTGWIQKYEDIKKVLIVEDSVCTGKSLNKYRGLIKEIVDKKINCIYLAAYVTPENKDLVDIYYRIITYPRMFEWNFLHQKTILKNACFDIDGVLCIDPTTEQNDDGEKYLDFIENATPNLIPSCPIGYIVSSRLEKYRKETEMWLSRNGIIYDKLFMLDGITAEERKSRNVHAQYKSQIYKELKDSNLFIESNKYQAQEINKITRKNVFCVENRVYYNESWIHSMVHTKNIKKIIKNIFKV